MGTITAQSIAANVSLVLQDTTNVQWSTDELIQWMNDGQRMIVVVRPDATATIAQITSVAGTQQTIPADGHELLDVLRNMGTSGTTPGRAITKASRRVLDLQQPTWHGQTPAPEAQHFVYDPRVPKTFYVYPPLQAGVKVELAYARAPHVLANLTDLIDVDDIYAPVLEDYVLYRAYMKDNGSGDMGRAKTHLDAFTAALSAKTTVDQQTAAAQQPALGGN